MNSLPKIDIMEATRLTREGRLREALDVLGGGAPLQAGATDAAAQAVLGSGFLSRLRRLAQAPVGRHAPRPAPPPMPGGARFLEKSFSNAAGTRAYKVYVPSTYVGEAVPLVVMLHGCTQSADDFAAGTRMNNLAEDMRFLVVYPEQSKAANASKCWNWFNPADQRRDGGEASIIAGVTRQVVKDYAVEASQIYVAGLSAGGDQAAIMGLAYPDLYAAVGVHSGLAGGAARDVQTAFSAMRKGAAPGAHGRGGHGPGAPAIVFHGDRDATVHPSNGEHVISQARAGEGRARDLAVEVRTGVSPGGVGFTQTLHVLADGRSALEHWTAARSGARVVGRQPGWILHGSERPGRQPRDAALLPPAPHGKPRSGAMKPWVNLGVAPIPGDAGELRLMQRDAEFSIRLGHTELMNSRLRGSEEALATLACAKAPGAAASRILVGGLGMGFTLRAALAVLGEGAQVDVVELVPGVVAWARGPMAALFEGCLSDPRVRIHESDVSAVIAAAKQTYDAILLDVDNGPEGLTREANDGLYDVGGPRLGDGGAPARRSSGRLVLGARPGLHAAAQARGLRGLRRAPPRQRQDRPGARHVIWLAARPPGKPSNAPHRRASG